MWTVVRCKVLKLEAWVKGQLLDSEIEVRL